MQRPVTGRFLRRVNIETASQECARWRRNRRGARPSRRERVIRLIDMVSPQTVRTLVETTGRHCVSIYMPTHRAGSEQDPIRLKNLLGRARAELAEMGVRRPAADELLHPATQLLTSARFWAEQGSGLALFLSDREMQRIRLPNPVEELVSVAGQFHLKPLLATVTGGELFYVLALSQNQVRLLKGDRYSMSELDLMDVPHSLDEALRFDDRERQLQSHGSGRVGRGQVAAAFHGHAMDKDAAEEDLSRFVTAVHRGVRATIAEPPAPLVLAGVARLAALYRRVNSHHHILEQGVEGNPEHLSPEALHAAAWPLVEPLFDRDRQAAADAFLSGRPPAARDVESAVVAAYQGRIETVFVPLQGHVWGSFEPDTLKAIEHEQRRPGERDLLDVIAAFTLAHGGKVFAVDTAAMPSSDPVAAVLRF